MVVAAGLRLPERQERVARAILARPDVVAFGTISSVASACVVSPSTVVRAANALGFETFKELKLFSRQHMRSLSASGRVISFQSFASTEP
ncbi:MurR/RpiR family transcriptional regulator [Rhizobium sp. LEGMi198b]